jgi:hypothetical protein
VDLRRAGWASPGRDRRQRAGRGAQARVCGRSCGAAARRGPARGQRGRAWRTWRWPGAGRGGGLARAAAEGAAPVRADLGPDSVAAGGEGGGAAGPGGPGGIGPARPRVRAGAFGWWAARLVSAGHARASWGPRGAGAERERRAGAAARRGGPAGGCAGLLAVLLQHMRVSREGSTREQEDPAVRVGVGIVNQPGSIVSSHGSMTSSSSYPSPIVQARPQHLEEARGPPSSSLFDPLYAGTSPPWQSRPPPPRVTVGSIPPAILHPLQPPGKLLRHPQNLAIIELLSPPILFAVGIHPPPVSLPNQGHPKVRPDPLNLPSAGDPLRRNVVVFFLSSVFPNQGLNCFDLESSGVFSMSLLYFESVNF